MRDDEDLDLIFTWREECKLSRNLTLHYKRVIYLVEQGCETLPRLLDKDPHVEQGAIVANKRSSPLCRAPNISNWG